MAQHADEESLRAANKRVQPFLDCVAYLLAKRWLRDQRQQADEPHPRDKQASHDEPLDP
jgi:hypothetical protein